MGSVHLTPDPRITLKDDSKLTLTEDSELKITQVQKIAPVAVHLKEVNHIDPISIEDLHVSEVRNIEPINIEKFNVTNLPMVNVSLRQLPPVDMNVRRLPPVSIGTHQNFQVPSNYMVRARFLGIEFFRIHLDGCSMIIPKERFRREQAKTLNRSFPVPAAAGNPAIPSIRREIGAKTSHPVFHCYSQPMSCTSRRGGFARSRISQKRITGGPAGKKTGAAHDRRSPNSFGLPATRNRMKNINRGPTGPETRAAHYRSSPASFGLLAGSSRLSSGG